MFTDLTDADLATLISNLRTAAFNLAMGQQVSDIRYGDGGESFHPADAEKTEQFLNRAIEERNNRLAGCTRSGSIHPMGI
jgi:hypothetical protein